MSEWCPKCECLTVENYDQTCAFCEGPVDRLDPFELAASVTFASTATQLVSAAVTYEGSAA